MNQVNQRILRSNTNLVDSVDGFFVVFQLLVTAPTMCRYIELLAHIMDQRADFPECIASNDLSEHQLALVMRVLVVAKQPVITIPVFRWAFLL